MLNICNGIRMPLHVFGNFCTHIASMDDGNIKGAIRQGDNALGLVTPYEARIFPHVDVWKGIPLPEGFGVAQGIAGDPLSAARTIDVLP